MRHLWSSRSLINLALPGQIYPEDRGTLSFSLRSLACKGGNNRRFPRSLASST
jgi:hypothetical protein